MAHSRRASPSQRHQSALAAWTQGSSHLRLGRPTLRRRRTPRQAAPLQPPRPDCNEVDTVGVQAEDGGRTITKEAQRELATVVVQAAVVEVRSAADEAAAVAAEEGARKRAHKKAK